MSDGIRRRDFLKVVGASSAGAGLLGCSTEDVERLIPYVVPPEEITPGVATWYASVCGGCSAGCGIWVRTREGRAVKVEGNPQHPVSRGGLCSRGQAEVHGLYDPDRLPGPMRREGEALVPIGWEEAESLLAERLGAGEALFLTGTLGPSMRELTDDFLAAVGGTRVEYEALSEAPLREATRIGFGRDVVPSYDLSGARLVLSFGADFLETWLSPVSYTRGFVDSTGVDEMGSKGRFVFLSPRLSLTGQNADEWVPLRPGSEGAVALALARIVAEERGVDGGPYAPVLEAYDVESAAEASGIAAEDLSELALRIVEEAPSVALGPGVAGQHRNATATNLAVLILNSVAGNVGRTVHLQSPDLGAPSSPFRGLASAIRGMEDGAYEVALVHGTNPAYTLPEGAGFRDAFDRVPFKVAFASSPDETSALCDLVLPDRHPLESWGDSRPRPGVYALRQPTMQPVPHFDSRPTGDLLLSVAGALGQDLGAETFLDYLKERWREVHALAGEEGTFEAFWEEALRTGFVEVQTGGEEAVELREPDAALSFDAPEFEGDGELTLWVYPSYRFGDGRHANRPWLQELPDPVSKITWHSWVEVNPATAEAMGLREGDVVRVASPHGEVEVPVWTYPGIREDVVALAMGGGHEEFGRYADGNGVNPMDLLPGETEEPSGGLVHLATRVRLERTGRRRRLASIEGSSTQQDRPIAPAVALDEMGAADEPAHSVPAEQGEESEEEHGEGGHGPLEELQGVGGFVPVPTEGRPEDFPLEGARHGEYADPENTPRWAMAIDLDKCTGCGACVTACQAENNVPWVGEDQILMGRDMNWIRVERYYEEVDATRAGPVDVRHLPMMCQHCGNAPCEPVCPVFAAYHTPDGLNAQVYNRCVGTRYCANNCPYKVRVFNWYSYTDVPEPLNWQYNPDVTVRDNGVMEKCTFCVQRIRDAQHRAVLEERGVRDGEVVPACQQSCPAQAIAFGDIRDPESRVARVAENERTYRVLDENINTQPAVNYLKKVTFHHVESGEHG